MDGMQQTPALDCFLRALPGEPRFTLLARDSDAPATILAWADARRERIIDGSAPESDLAIVQEAQQKAAAMRAWRAANMGAWREPEAIVPQQQRDLHDVLKRRSIWCSALAVAAPHAAPIVINLAAALLAGNACSDALLIAADAIDEQASLVSMASHDFAPEQRSLHFIATALRREAPSRASISLCGGEAEII